MEIIKWLFITVGMSTLVVGLITHAYGVLHHQNLVPYASAAYLLGAFILVAPPTIERKQTKQPDERKFAELLIVLEAFLVLSSAMYYVSIDPIWKGPIRLAFSLMVTAFLKYGLEQLPEFQWNVVYNPLEFIRYHWRAFVGTLGPAYSMSLGIDWLGVGYAFLDYPFGRIALLIGAIYLTVSALRGFLATRQPISLAWTGLNITYTLFGFFFVFMT